MLQHTSLLEQIDRVLADWKRIRATSKHEDCSDHPDYVTSELVLNLIGTIERIAPVGSHHERNVRRISDRLGDSCIAIPSLIGALQALRRDVELGYLRSVEDLVHADIFADFVEMADYLLESGYKDAAAVIIGSVLEQHLRSLSTKNGMLVEVNGKRKKADSLNSELASGGVLGKLDQKSVTAWLNLRNDAAHGNYGAYDTAQVKLMSEGVRQFIQRLPA